MSVPYEEIYAHKTLRKYVGFVSKNYFIFGKPGSRILEVDLFSNIEELLNIWDIYQPTDVYYDFFSPQYSHMDNEDFIRRLSKTGVILTLNSKRKNFSMIH